MFGSRDLLGSTVILSALTKIQLRGWRQRGAPDLLPAQSMGAIIREPPVCCSSPISSHNYLQCSPRLGSKVCSRTHSPSATARTYKYRHRPLCPNLHPAIPHSMSASTGSSSRCETPVKRDTPSISLSSYALRSPSHSKQHSNSQPRM